VAEEVLSEQVRAAWLFSSTVTDMKYSDGISGYLHVDLVDVRLTPMEEQTNCVRGSGKIRNDYAAFRVFGKGIDCRNQAVVPLLSSEGGLLGDALVELLRVCRGARHDSN